ncbi:hypothetical protein ANCCEY_14080 [Ancylostoma ceylanicum]|nr:hypothetical protein ANCCEY_14080 [Ancylostoma ceylanicum]
MIEELFLSGAATMDRYASAKVLILGLGGGYMNTHLHHNFPKMDITVIEIEPQMLEISRKWFGLTLDERQRVIIKDGVHFLENAVAEGHKYDAILVDACVTDVNEWIICPCESFVKHEMVENYAKLLSERGAFIVNVLSVRYTSKSVGRELRNMFSAAFKNCIIKQSHSETNTVMTCTQQPRPRDLDRQYEVFAEYKKYGGRVSELIDA